MNIEILSTNFTRLHYLDIFKSFIWTERYCESGDFEIYTPIDIHAYLLLAEDNYLRIPGSDAVMIIETRKIKTYKEDGDYLLVSGRSLESILDRRIVWGQSRLYGNFQEAIEHLLCEAFIEPTDTDRTVDNFIFEESDDEAITSLTIDTQVMGDNLYDVIQILCDVRNLGFRITLTEDYKFKFKLYSGVDRSYDQLTNPLVAFSEDFDNIITSDHTSDKSKQKTISLVLGPGEGLERTATTAEAPEGAGTGLDRRELCTDASSISEEVDGITLDPEDYINQLNEAGLADLADHIWYEVFEGQVDAEKTFIFGRDFSLGDIVQLTDKYGRDGQARVMELIRSEDPSGTAVYPTFAMI